MEQRARSTVTLGFVLALMLGSLAGKARAGTPHEARVLVAVSFSMPEQSLKQWLYQARHYQVPVVIRGLVDHSFKRTYQRLHKLTDEDGRLTNGVQLDPTVFRRFGIERVPAVVAVHRSQDTSPAGHQSPAAYDVVYGDVSLQRALRALAEQGNEAKDEAREVLRHGQAD